MDIIPVITGIANFYLLRAGSGFVLVDTGSVLNRGRLRRALDEAGCQPGNLTLVIITHADFDHTGNAAWLKKKYGAKLSLHPAELPAVNGNMLNNRKAPVGRFVRGTMRVLGWVLGRPFAPDLLLEEERDMNKYGLDARIVFIPGHSQGSIGMLTAEGDFFCGDLLNNAKKKPVKNWLVDVPAEMDASIKKLEALAVRIVYPGHGQPFAWHDFSPPDDVS